MKNNQINQILVMTPNGPVPFEQANVPHKVKMILSDILRDLFPNERKILEQVSSHVEPEMTISYYIGKVAERNGFSFEDANTFLKFLYNISPVATLNILLRAIAMEMDMNYPDHISDAEELWSVDDIDGEVFRMDVSGKGLNYRNFPAFRCEEDAVGACMILRPLFRSIYGKQKDKGSN